MSVSQDMMCFPPPPTYHPNWPSYPVLPPWAQPVYVPVSPYPTIWA